jgi:signal transduction histidine kinase/CheY-like chemotaxis protein
VPPDGLERLLEVALGTIVEAVAISDAAGRICWCNASFGRLVGRASDELIGELVLNVLRLRMGEEPCLPEDHPWAVAIRTKRRSSGLFELQISGRPLDLQITATPVITGDEITVVLAMLDLTDRRLAEVAMTRTQEELEGLVLRRTQELEDAKRGLENEIIVRKNIESELRIAKNAAESASRAKSTFLANMSHELRTPLNAIIGYSEMVEEEANELGYDQIIPDLHKIRDAGSHLLSLISNILDLSKIEAGKMEAHLDTFEVASLFETVVNTIQPIANSSEIELIATCPADIGTMRSDKVKIRQVLINMLSNACKFTQRGRVELTIARAAEPPFHVPNLIEDWLCFRVADTGVGMSPQQVAVLFREFSQVNASASLRNAGTGLGLALSKRFCRMLGGDILVESTPGVGTTFTVWLPSTPEEITGSSAMEAATIWARPRRSLPPIGVVLVIADDPWASQMMKAMVAKESIRTVSARTGAEGLRLARELHPFAITIDVQSPGLGGWTVLDELKRDPSLSEVPVVLAAALEGTETAFAISPAAWVTLPLDKESFAKRLRTFARVGHAMVVSDDGETRSTLRRTIEQSGWTAVDGGGELLTLERLSAKKIDLLLVDPAADALDALARILELKREPSTSSIPIAMILRGDLVHEHHQRLCSASRRALQSGGLDRDQISREISIALKL